MLLKSLTGGDKLKARSNNVDAREFNIQSSIILTANDIPTCEPADALENLKVPLKFYGRKTVDGKATAVIMLLQVVDEPL